MANKFVNFGFKPGQAKKWGDKVLKNNQKAAAATLNALSKKGIAETAKEISAETGVKQAQVRKRIRVRKAFPFNLDFSWFISGRRLSWIKPRTLKKSGRRTGVSHLVDNKKRKRVTSHIGDGSKAFVINVNKNEEGKRGNKLAVFRKKGQSRKVTKLAGHSIPWLLSEDWEERIKAGLVKLMPDEMRKQLKKLKFRK